jgi:hypothetical protein
MTELMQAEMGQGVGPVQKWETRRGKKSSPVVGNWAEGANGI